MTSHAKNTQPGMENDSSLAFIFNGNEMIAQCTANHDGQAAAVNIMSIALQNYQ
jgi:hypothetical protein